MKILGINACLAFNFDHTIRTIDGGGVCLIEDGVLTIGISEERITKKKYDGGFKNSLKYIFDTTGYTMENIDKIVCSFYGVPFEVPDNLKKELVRELELCDDKKLEIIPSHHLSHAYSAYFLSDYSDALVIVSDNEGQIIEGDMYGPLLETSCERNSYYIAHENDINLIRRDFDYPKAIGFGKMYNKFTRFLGFESYHNAGKTMGLAPFALKEFKKMGDLYYFDEEDKLRSIIDDSGDYVKDVQTMLKKVGFSIIEPKTSKSPMTQNYAEIAGYVQYQLEKWQIKVIEKIREQKNYKFDNICVSGGVALNCPTNTKLSDLPYIKSVFVPSAPHDQGQCIGNCIFGYVNLNKCDKKINIEEQLYLGKSYEVGQDIILKLIHQKNEYKFFDLRNFDRNKTIAKLLNDGKIVSIFQGKSEFGPRALGNRSIIANPGDSFIKDRINIDVKHRESFRPFAPSILEEEVDTYFIFKNKKSPSMMFTAIIKEEYRKTFPAILHVDGSSRLQTVTKQSNENYYNLLVEFKKLSGHGMFLNTSFNLNGMPIVETPEDAFNCFDTSSLDALVLDNFLIIRR